MTKNVALIASALFNASTTPSVAGWLRTVAHRVRVAAMHGRQTRNDGRKV